MTVIISGADSTEKNKQILITIWRETLGIDEINPDSDFFQLGGDSLQMMTMLYSLQQEAGVELSPGDVFDNPTVHQLAAFITSAEQLEGRTHATSDGII